jgi:DNA-binding HxlR family transcriptional regulator
MLMLALQLTLSNNGLMNDHDHHPPSAFCPVYHRAIELIGRRWTGAILRVLMSGPTRFSDIAVTVPGLSDRLLSERLKELEAEGIVVRTVYPETPVRIEYALTEKGHALEGVIAAVSDWAETWASLPAADDERSGHDDGRSEGARARELVAAPAGD